MRKKLNECLERGALDCNKLNCLHLKKLFVRSKVNCVWTHLYLFETRAISNGVVTDNLQWLCFLLNNEGKMSSRIQNNGTNDTTDTRHTHTHTNSVKYLSFSYMLLISQQAKCDNALNRCKESKQRRDKVLPPKKREEMVCSALSVINIIIDFDHPNFPALEYGLRDRNGINKRND